MEDPLEDVKNNELRLVVLELRNIKDRVIGVDKKIDEHLVTKDQLKLHVAEEFAKLDKDVLEPMKAQIQDNSVKANWAMRFVIVTLSTISLAVLGAILKTNLHISL